MSKQKYIRDFSEISMKDVSLVGGKNASLGEMYSNLAQKGINVPPGFAVTAKAYRYFIKHNKLEKQIIQILKKLRVANLANLAEKGEKIRQLILDGELPKDLKQEISEAYKTLTRQTQTRRNKNLLSAAVRSSATAEDLPGASFAGQQETYLNIKGNFALLESVKKCFASLFTDRAISYRQEKGFKHLQVALSVGVQKMVRSDLSCSGVMFTIDTESGFPGIVLINAAYGLGEYIVKGVVNPDEYYVFKGTLEKYRPIIYKSLGSKKRKLVYSVGDNILTQDAPVSFEDQRKHTLSENEILQLAKWGVQIEDYYSQIAESTSGVARLSRTETRARQPMDIEWAKDGTDGKLYIVQARPETVHSTKKKNEIEEYILQKKSKVLCLGASVGNKIGRGKVKNIKDVQNINRFKRGEVLVTEMTDPDWEPIMKKAAAIVTNSGGRTCHAAIVSRELNVPCIVGTKNATQVLKNDQPVTASCAEGEHGKIYKGLLPFKIKRTNIAKMPKTKTKIMMNIGDPEIAFKYAGVPNDGVGLARIEFVINSSVKIHPMALLSLRGAKRRSVSRSFSAGGSNPAIGAISLTDETIKKIKELTCGYKDKSEYYVDKLSQGIAQLAAAFYPKEIIVRFSDFKTNEYANLIGGETFEPKEQNPMLGWRGASRYYDPRFKPAFDLECQAIKRVREKMGLYNVSVMIPFCRTVEEGKKVLEILRKNGLNSLTVSQLKRKNKLFGCKADGCLADKLKVYMMCEIPSNVILAEEFAKIFYGFSIGSNDLTQLALGVDRDSELVSHIYDERNEAVKSLIREVIKKAHKHKRKIGICGQAPSDFPGFAEFLVEAGIDSISLNPDTVLATTIRVAKAERRK